MDLIEIENHLMKLKSEDKKLIGIFPHQLIPLELIHAFNVNPVVLSLAANDEICSLGTEYLTPATCPFARGCVGFLDSEHKIYSNLDGLIGLNYCNGDLCAVDYIERYFKIPQIQFAFPTVLSENSRKFFLNQVYKLKTNLENFFKIQVSNGDLIKSIDLYNKLRLKFRNIQNLIGMGSNFQNLMHDLYLLGPEYCYNRLEELEENNTIIKNSGVNTLFLGSFVGLGDKILNIIEDCDIKIVKNQSESILFFYDDVNKDNPLENLADYYFQNNFTFRMINDDQKINKIIKEYEKGTFKAVIFHVLKFCDIYVAELSKFKTIMAENDIPTLILERDYAESLGQLSTRIEAFREILS
ncbi:MAG: 2-hydroxyacyl-CoA dehydratase [Candidatus Lokiarchaeota archaeon]|nr:2-hydroxyacyl-CoA dehydratase [Candidatus Lokiarchaeota archaeon]